MKTDVLRLRLVASCPDRPGIVARISTFLAGRGASITEAAQYHEPSGGMFFMRWVFDHPADGTTVELLREDLRPVAEELQMEWRLVDAARVPRVVMLVSKFDHCLAYLLHRRKVGDLPIEIPCVISNHDALRELVEWYGIPYHHVPVPPGPEAKQAGFDRTAALIEEAAPDTIVLARYMQIFRPWLCQRYRHRVLNIHHSFLPSFLGARPYHQAAERDIKGTALDPVPTAFSIQIDGRGGGAPLCGGEMRSTRPHSHAVRAKRVATAVVLPIYPLNSLL